MRTGCHHSVAWYSHELAPAFGEALLDRLLTMPQALRRAIADVAQRHGGCSLTGGSPSATVAAWRLHPRLVEYLVLCDASVVLATVDGVVEVTDDRLTVLMADRLGLITATTGDPAPAASVVLEARAAVLESSRNVAGGFWCRQAEPSAADQAVVGSSPLSDTVGIVIASDGATRGFLALGAHTVEEFMTRALDGEGAGLLEDIRSTEEAQGQHLLASAIKVHDDATLVALYLADER
jgi:hypothetical protein